MHVNNNEIYDYLLDRVPLGFPSQKRGSLYTSFLVVYVSSRVESLFSHLFEYSSKFYPTVVSNFSDFFSQHFVLTIIII